MSENVDLVRSIFAQWELGEYGSVEWAHREIDFVVADGPVPSSAKVVKLVNYRDRGRALADLGLAA